jgi:hypothetical protein
MDETELLIRDLCARAYNDTIVDVAYWVSYDGKPELEWSKEKLTLSLLHQIEEEEGAWGYIKPYLRSLSSMTKEEAEEMFHLMYPNDKFLKVELEQDRVRFTRLVGGESFQGILTLFFNKIYSLEQLDWYYSKHFDVRDLIGKNLAIEVNKENNPYEKIDMVCWLKENGKI